MNPIVKNGLVGLLSIVSVASVIIAFAVFLVRVPPNLVIGIICLPLVAILFGASQYFGNIIVKKVFK